MATPSYDDIVQKDILELLELQNIPDDQKQAIYKKLYEIVENRTILRMDHLLSEPDVDAWKKLLEQGDRAAADAFLKEKNIDVQRILIEETAMLKAQLVFMLESSQTSASTVPGQVVSRSSSSQPA